MNVGHRSGTWVIVFTLVIGMMLCLVPIPEWADRLRPQWVSLVVLYWCMALPDRVGVGIAWLTGLLLDVARGTLLGQHALAMSLMALITLKSHQRVRVLPLWEQAVTVFLFLMVNQLAVHWVNGISGFPPTDWWYLAPPLSSTLLWPWVFVLLRDLRRRFRVT